MFPAGDHLDHVGGDVNRLYGVDECTFDGLLDPPGGIGAKARALFGVESFDGAHESEVSFFDEVGQRHAPAAVFFGDTDNEAEITADHAVACCGVVLVDDLPGQVFLLVGGQQRRGVNLFEVDL